MPYAAARSSMWRIAICFEIGVEYAYLLSSATTTSGIFCTAAKFIPSWNAPVLVAPSPIHAIATRGSERGLRMRDPIAIPAATGIESPSMLIGPTTTGSSASSSGRWTMWMLRSRPRELLVPFAMYWRKISSGRTPIAINAPMLRISGRIASRRLSA